jgi:hypothetical protein
MKNLTAARDAVGSEEPIATGGWSFLIRELDDLMQAHELNKARLRELVDLLFSRWWT